MLPIKGSGDLLHCPESLQAPTLRIRSIMLTTRDEILKAALQLSEAERLSLVDELMNTLPKEALGLSVDDPDFAEELQRRSGDWEGSIRWEDLRDEFRRSQ
ncbi:MAG TPA: hypothetical protein VHB77_05420 [Planctomycetaceae bacterium]|nr:hypothetical protein [Planctomycetaceae bacterium]